eukprot:662139-Lingulodinium_polyedra.AAC.1
MQRNAARTHAPNSHQLLVRAWRARAPHCAALKRRTARSTASSRNVFQTLRNDAVKRAVRRVNAA